MDFFSFLLKSEFHRGKDSRLPIQAKKTCEIASQGERFFGTASRRHDRVFGAPSRRAEETLLPRARWERCAPGLGAISALIAQLSLFSFLTFSCLVISEARMTVSNYSIF
jgi:hypothetical protein